MAEPLFDSTFLRKLDRLSLVTRQAMLGNLQGERRSPRRGASVEFADFRPYTPGDDIRQLDWNLYARMEKFFLKMFVAEEELTVHLLLDNTASMNWGEPNKLDFARRVAAAFGYITLSSLDRVTVSSYADGAQDQLPGVRGKRGAMPLFSFMQNIRPGVSASLLKSCKCYAQRTKVGGPLLLCSDLMDPDWKDALRVLSSQRFELTVLHVLAPQELEPALDGDFRLIDAESGEAVEISADLETLQRYEQHLKEWQTEVENFCSGRNINYIFANCATPIEDFVMTQLRQRAVVR